MFAYTWPLLDLFWTFLMFAGIVLLLFFVIWCFIDNFRRRDHRGCGQGGVDHHHLPDPVHRCGDVRHLPAGGRGAGDLSGALEPRREGPGVGAGSLAGAMAVARPRCGWASRRGGGDAQDVAAQVGGGLAPPGPRGPWNPYQLGVEFDFRAVCR